MGKQFVFDTCAFIHLEPYIIRLVLLSGAASKGKSLKKITHKIFTVFCTNQQINRRNQQKYKFLVAHLSLNKLVFVRFPLYAKGLLRKRS